MNNSRIKIINACFDFGAGTLGAKLGPESVFTAARELGHSFLNKTETQFLHPPHQSEEINSQLLPLARRIDDIIAANRQNYNEMLHSCKSGYTPLILSGDHSNAIGFISAVIDAFPAKRTGVIWVDAHLDLHSPYTTPSGNIHGMALNALIGDDNIIEQVNNPDEVTLSKWSLLKSCGELKTGNGPLAQDIVFIGIRDFEEQEIKLAQRLGIKIFSASEVRETGISNIVTETLSYLSHCDQLYVSFDVDSQDPEISRGTGTPVENGLLTPDSQEIFDRLFTNDKTVAFEITEINPLLDTENKMAKSVVNLLKRVM